MNITIPKQSAAPIHRDFSCARSLSIEIRNSEFENPTRHACGTSHRFAVDRTKSHLLAPQVKRAFFTACRPALPDFFRIWDFRIPWLLDFGGSAAPSAVIRGYPNMKKNNLFAKNPVNPVNKRSTNGKSCARAFSSSIKNKHLLRALRDLRVRNALTPISPDKTDSNNSPNAHH